MSGIEIGSSWVNRCDGVDAIVKSVGNDCVGFTQIINGKEYFYSHTAEEFKEYYEPKVKADMVNHPPHYKDASGIECIEVTKYMSFLGGNCFKYLYRAGSKGDAIEDLKKAAWYAERAWIMDKPIERECREKLRQVAKCRSGNIFEAMESASYNEWDMVEKHVRAEIARLESE